MAGCLAGCEQRSAVRLSAIGARVCLWAEDFSVPAAGLAVVAKVAHSAQRRLPLRLVCTPSVQNFFHLHRLAPPPSQFSSRQPRNLKAATIRNKSALSPAPITAQYSDPWRYLESSRSPPLIIRPSQASFSDLLLCVTRPLMSATQPKPQSPSPSICEPLLPRSRFSHTVSVNNIPRVL